MVTACTITALACHDRTPKYSIPDMTQYSAPHTAVPGTVPNADGSADQRCKLPRLSKMALQWTRHARLVSAAGRSCLKILSHPRSQRCGNCWSCLLLPQRIIQEPKTRTRAEEQTRECKQPKQRVGSVLLLCNGLDMPPGGLHRRKLLCRPLVRLICYQDKISHCARC